MDEYLGYKKHDNVSNLASTTVKPLISLVFLPISEVYQIRNFSNVPPLLTRLSGETGLSILIYGILRGCQTLKPLVQAGRLFKTPL
jgi:hypothetical protein